MHNGLSFFILLFLLHLQLPLVAKAQYCPTKAECLKLLASKNKITILDIAEAKGESKKIDAKIFKVSNKTGADVFLDLAKQKLKPEYHDLLKEVIRIENSHAANKPVAEQLKYINATMFLEEQKWSREALKEMLNGKKLPADIREHSEALIKKIDDQISTGRVQYYELLDQTLDYAYLASGKIRDRAADMPLYLSSTVGNSLYGVRKDKIIERIYVPARQDLSPKDINLLQIFGFEVLGKLKPFETRVADGQIFEDAIQFMGHDIDHGKDITRFLDEMYQYAKKDPEKFKRMWQAEMSTFRDRLRTADIYLVLEKLEESLVPREQQILEASWFYLTHEGHGASLTVHGILDYIKLLSHSPEDLAFVLKTFQDPNYLGGQLVTPKAVNASDIKNAFRAIETIIQKTPYRTGL